MYALIVSLLSTAVSWNKFLSAARSNGTGGSWHSRTGGGGGAWGSGAGGGGHK